MKWMDIPAIYILIIWYLLPPCWDGFWLSAWSFVSFLQIFCWVWFSWIALLMTVLCLTMVSASRNSNFFYCIIITQEYSTLCIDEKKILGTSLLPVSFLNPGVQSKNISRQNERNSNSIGDIVMKNIAIKMLPLKVPPPV